MSYQSIIEIFNVLEGEWSIIRDISGYGQYQGNAFFEKKNPYEISFFETGFTQTYLDKKINSSQRYCYRLENNFISVYFTHQEKLFYQLSTLNFCNKFYAATAEHQCLNDLYQITYYFYNNNHFDLIYIVRGPHKQYRSNSQFLRRGKKHGC